MNKYSQEFYNSVSSRAVQSARITAGAIAGAIEPVSVVDIGSGQGVWLHTISEFVPTVKRAVALDIQSHKSPFFDALLKSSIDFKFVEANFENSSTLPDEQFDMAICLEVLEHLTPDTAVEVARDIGKKCSCLIFSAAILGQGGTGHINEQKFSYWMQLMRDQGFIALDIFRPALRKADDVPSYYKQNMMFFWHPQNSKRNGVKIDLNALLSRNSLDVVDNRSALTRIRYRLIAYVPPQIVTALVKVLDNSIRKFNKQ
jgi:2-polyprenyl-3-methyl-5-hydroxy-6-metoxy-1,4-benzoquinol methylase